MGAAAREACSARALRSTGRRWRRPPRPRGGDWERTQRPPPRRAPRRRAAARLAPPQARRCCAGSSATSPGCGPVSEAGGAARPFHPAHHAWTTRHRVAAGPAVTSVLRARGHGGVRPAGGRTPPPLLHVAHQLAPADSMACPAGQGGRLGLGLAAVSDAAGSQRVKHDPARHDAHRHVAPSAAPCGGGEPQPRRLRARGPTRPCLNGSNILPRAWGAPKSVSSTSTTPRPRPETRAPLGCRHAACHARCRRAGELTRVGEEVAALAQRQGAP